MRSRRRAFLPVLVLLGTLCPAVTVSAAERQDVRPVTALAEGPDLAAMLDLETKITDHLHYGIVTPVTFPDATQTPGTVVGTDSWGDSGLWSGVYLGGEALRYRTAVHHLHRHGGSDEQTFWTAQRDDALAHVRAILGSEHRDINISASWTGTLKVPPSVNTQNPTGRHLVDYGGGVIHGEAGMMQRACTPKDAGPFGVSAPSVDKNNPVNDHANRVYEITWLTSDGGDGQTYRCETSPSRDTYAGVTFGLLTAFDLVSVDFPQMRHQITHDLLAMGNFLLKYGWCYPRPTGYVVSPGGNDFDGSFSTLMPQVPMARLNMTNAARHVADLDGGAGDRAKWDAVWAEELSSQGASLPGSMAVDSAQPESGYYKFNLHHLTAFNLLRTLTGPARELVLQSVAVMDKTTRGALNAHFEAITYSQTGEKARKESAILHLQQWRDYRAYTGAGNLVSHQSECGVRFACTTDDPGNQLIVDGGAAGPVTVLPGSPLADKSRLRAIFPRPVAERPPTDFLWQRPPTALTGQEPATYREPGIDFLTPYWMLRYYTEAVRPAQTPMPDSPSPAFL